MELARPGAPDRPPTWGSNQSREAIHQIIPISPLHMPLSRRSSRIITPRFIDQRSIERELAREGDEGGARQAGRQREALVGGCPEAGRHRARGHPCRPAGGGRCVCVAPPYVASSSIGDRSACVPPGHRMRAFIAGPWAGRVFLLAPLAPPHSVQTPAGRCPAWRLS